MADQGQFFGEGPFPGLQRMLSLSCILLWQRAEIEGSKLSFVSFYKGTSPEDEAYLFNLYAEYIM